MLRLSWLKLEGGHGYASVANNICRHIAKAGATIVASDSFDWDAIIAIHPAGSGAAFLGPHNRPEFVFHTMTEANRIPESWVKILNRTGVVWVPSTFSEQVFRDSGVKIPIFVAGYGVDADPVRRAAHDGPFKVLAWGDTLTSRKNIIKAIEAFIAADLPNAQLEVKLNLDGLPIPTMAWSDGVREHPNITICHEYWPKRILREWLRSGDVGMYLSGGEGYGLMPKEMMATGLPIISVINTGLVEYLSPGIVLHVPSDALRPSPYFNRIYKSTGLMEHVPDFEATVEHLRYAYHNREALYDLGMRGAAHVAQFTWERAGRIAFERLSRYYGTDE